MTSRTLTFPVPAALTPAADMHPLTLLTKGFEKLVAWQKRDRERRLMDALEDWQLDDLGLARANINARLAADAETPIWEGFAR